jgi:hypothetical protein
MRRTLTIATALIALSGTAYAQSMPGGSAMTGTSQLGIPGASAASGGTGLTNIMLSDSRQRSRRHG